MPFLDKLGGIARNIGDKTSEVIETTKLNSKINGEKTAISECMRKIGEIHYQKYLDGESGSPEETELFYAIDGHNKTISDTQAEIDRIKAEGGE